MSHKKAVHFGAGLIGRGFIAELLHDSGYEVVLLDVVDDVIDQVNKNKEYPLFKIDHDYEEKIIDDVSALSTIKDQEKAIEEIEDADVITTSVMATNLSRIAPLLAKGLKNKLGKAWEKAIVMACENAILGTDILKDELIKTGEITEDELDQVAVFPNTAVDRMVFAGEHNGKQGVEIGDAYELAIEKGKLENPDEEPILGAEYVDDIMRYLQRKIYIINNGHAVGAYFGKLKGYDTLQQVLEDPETLALVKEAMTESAAALSKKYGFPMEELEDYMQKMMIDRWLTPGVVTELDRIGLEPTRKISKSDRIMGPALLCEEYGLDNKTLLKAVAAGLRFDNPDDQDAVEMQEFIKNNGIEEAITKYTSLEPGTDMYNTVLEEYQNL